MGLKAIESAETGRVSWWVLISRRLGVQLAQEGFLIKVYETFGLTKG